MKILINIRIYSSVAAAVLPVDRAHNIMIIDKKREKKNSLSPASSNGSISLLGQPAWRRGREQEPKTPILFLLLYFLVERKQKQECQK
jgi:hypothetical protein